ncbi:enoyl-CoA hydratase/isomerase [Massilia sp. NR 4-1]|uniref:enoyl-CoA hydratase/isomerase n=1 Tax=Massilia sp. NR 4-1 TaxID=1678028 RepID=UPI00067D9BCB|nr:enoyl-CoA hydratase/isomerase [Massilia sp. NR 4-1]AKU21007.1 enoyl-CoA hydratase [Massilia sp. NR 4-1]
MTRYSSIEVSRQGPVCLIQFAREAAGNTINATLVDECLAALDALDAGCTVVVLRGHASSFCNGADFAAVQAATDAREQAPEALYALWTRLAYGPFVSVALVEGRANAGGIGFVAACNIVLAGPRAEFSLSEMLFGLLPACVTPFLARRVGWQRAQYMTLMTRAFDAPQALQWGLVDALDERCEVLLSKHLSRLRCLPAAAIVRYKHYLAELPAGIEAARPLALATNRAVFADPDNLAAIEQYVSHGRLRWERPNQ